MGKNEKQPKITANEQMAVTLLSYDSGSQPDSLDEMYAADSGREPANVDLETDADSINILHMSELLVGHKDSAVDFYRQVIDSVKEMPDEMRPDAIVLSGIIQGDFKLSQKKRRSSLNPYLRSMNQQFKAAKELLDHALSTDLPVIYNMSDDDHRIAEDYTLEVFRTMEKLASNNEGLAYYQQDKLKEHPEWDKHLQFQIDVVFPYCLRAGRRLYSAEEVAEKTGGEPIEEYFMLYDSYQRMSEGKRPRKRYAEIVQEECLRESNDLIIVDDANISITTQNRKYLDMIRHNLNFTSTSMSANHMKTPLEILGAMASSGEVLPDMIVTQNNQEAVGVNKDGTWVVSSGGLIDPTNFLNSKGSVATASGDITRRLNTTRRRAHAPSATAHERTDDGRHRVTIFNEKLMEKAHSLEERTAIALYCDWQTGSITARPDLQVKFMDYFRTRKMGEMATAIFVGGDIVHGRNYPDFASESQSTGLMSMDSQIDFVKRMLREEFENMTKEDVRSLQKVVIEPGNHEWNSGTKKWHGYSFIDYLEDAFKGLYERHGLTREEVEQKVQFHDAVQTARGEFARTYSGIGYFGDIGVEVRHFALERGGKGSGGNLPIYQTHDQATGLGQLRQSIDVSFNGHWHHPQYAVFGNKISITSGSLAGLSGYEYDRAYRPVIGGATLEIGAGQPPVVEFILEDALHAHEIKAGTYSEQSLAEKGFTSDREFDAKKHGIMMADSYAKSGLQKALLSMMRESSQSAYRTAELR